MEYFFVVIWRSFGVILCPWEAAAHQTDGLMPILGPIQTAREARLGPKAYPPVVNPTKL
jgi:hypothetical protein